MIELEDGTFSFVVGIRNLDGKINVGVMTTDFDEKVNTVSQKVKVVVTMVKKELLGAKTVLVRVK